MISDSVEATLKGLRAVGKVDENNINEIITNIISDLTKEEQIDELTIKQGRIITDVLISEYNAVNHKRVTTNYEPVVPNTN